MHSAVTPPLVSTVPSYECSQSVVFRALCFIPDSNSGAELWTFLPSFMYSGCTCTSTPITNRKKNPKSDSSEQQIAPVITRHSHGNSNINTVVEHIAHVSISKITPKRMGAARQLATLLSPIWIFCPSSRTRPLSDQQSARSSKVTYMMSWSSWCARFRESIGRVGTAGLSSRSRCWCCVLVDLFADCHEKPNQEILLVHGRESSAGYYRGGMQYSPTSAYASKYGQTL